MMYTTDEVKTVADAHVPEIKNLPHGFGAIYLSHNDLVVEELRKNGEQGESKS